MGKLRVPILVCLLAAAVFPGRAAAGNLTAESFPVTLKGASTSEHVFTIEEGLAVKCKKATYSGTLSEASSSVSLTPTFSECTAFGSAATVTTTGCKFVFEIGLESESGFPSTLGISCEAGKALIITSGTCEVQIPTQSGRETVQAANNGSSEVSFELGISKATYTKTKDGFLCPLNGTGTKEDGSLSGKSNFSGETAGIQIITYSILCKDNIGKKCDDKQVLKPKQAFTGSATDFKIVLQYDDGTIAKNVTVSCAKASLSGTTLGYINNPAAKHAGQQETPLESFSTQNCSEEKGVECTSPVEIRKVPSTGYLHANANGNGDWEEIELKLKVSCATANVTFTCFFSKKMSFSFEGDGTNAKAKLPGVGIDPEKPVTGEKNCGKNAATITATYTLSIGAFLRKG